jgi:hemerythrin-like metal-binding protein
MSSLTDSSPWRLEWKDELSVGIPEIDVEHKNFIRLVSELNESISSRMDVAEITRRIQAILDDSIAHFEHEEALFKEWGYPDAAEHEKKHDQIILALRNITNRPSNGMTEYEWIDAGLRIKKTLIEHLLVEDMKYRDYCQNKQKQMQAGES